MAVPQAVIRQWSTREVPEAQRMDYYAEVLSSAIDPMGVAKRLREPFNADIESVELGPITVIHGAGGAHDAIRGQRDLARSRGRNFHLIVNRASAWNIEHLGSRHVCQGDALLVDSRYPHAYRFVSPFDNVHLRLPEEWLTRWVAQPDVLVGRPILSDSNWGSALTAFVSQLSPQFVANAPLPHALIADHIGALLALFANEVSAGAPIAQPVQRALADGIHEIIVQRCTEPA
ncbi:MAG: AraC family transcriptional regulator, partial [Pseudoxanthomonas sp.]